MKGEGRMEAIREFSIVKNGKVEIDLPEYLENEEVEVLVLPLRTTEEDLSFLEADIAMGRKSAESPLGLDEIRKMLKQRYA
jgi:hypothetical protein